MAAATMTRPRTTTRRRPTRRTFALRRAMVSLFVLALLVAAFSAGTALRSDAADADALGETTVVVVPGDTVWDIALDHLPAGRNAHAYAAEVLDHNDLDAAAVRPGTVLRLPR